MRHELTEEIRNMLEQQHAARCLDDEEDFTAVLESINNTIEKWMSFRCPGCR